MTAGKVLDNAKKSVKKIVDKVMGKPRKPKARKSGPSDEHHADGDPEPSKLGPSKL